MSGDVSNERTRLRQTQRGRIEQCFREHVGLRVASSDLHAWFGSSFRTRVSEINRDPAAKIRIQNETSTSRSVSGTRREQSVYWAELAPKVHWPATFEQLEELGYVYLGGKKCDCGETFLWWKTPAGNPMPISVIGDNRLVPHQARCKNAKRDANARRARRQDAARPLQSALFAL